jgi:hypothetical protein
MTLTRFCAAFAAFATMTLLFAAPASAQATRTWVSGVGDDANPCSRTAPCKTFAGAISKTAPAGEIECLDPGGFGALTITKSITINCEYVVGRGGVLVSGTNGIVISAATTDKVTLIGLDIDGLNTGLNGVQIIQAGNVAILDCLIYEFNGTPASPGVPGSAGINVQASSSVSVYVQNSIIRNNLNGVVNGASGIPTTVELDHVALDGNTTNLNMNSSSATTRLNASTLTGGVGILNTAGGSVVSFGNNAIKGGGSGPTSTTPLQ